MSTPLPPLVEPAAELTREEVARYSRHLIIPDLGVDGQKRLKNARVLVIGAGGLGSPTLLYLAAAGVGTIGIVEFDVVDESNLQRQIIHGQSDIGRSKAQSARDSILEINPLVEVRLHELRLEPYNAVDLFKQYDLILDGTDNFATRYLVNDAAVLAGKPYVWGSIYRFEGQVSVFWEDAPDGRGLNYRDLYPEPPPPGDGAVLRRGRRAGHPVRVDRLGDGHRGHQADHRHRRSAAGPADGLRRAGHDLPHHQDPQGPVHAEDHRADRLRGVLRCGVRGGRRGRRRFHDHPARAARDAGLGQAAGADRRARTRRVGHQPHRGRRADSEVDASSPATAWPSCRTTARRCCTARPVCDPPRSLAAVKKAGFSDAMHLQGGIVAWAKQLEPDMVMY